VATTGDGRATPVDSPSLVARGTSHVAASVHSFLSVASGSTRVARRAGR
jgi:hypothetical protein